MAESAFDGRPLVGDVVAGKYRIESVAGEGGMGIVYEAEHVILRQRIALKVLRPETMSSAEALERFSVEAAAIARLKTEHVVRVMDAGSLPTGAPYLVMELLEGSDLEKLLARTGPLPPQDVVDYALQALEALAHAHAASAIHRDLKPANLFLATLPDGRRIIKLLDFGIATAVDLSVEEDPDRILGSPAYMSPEQLMNEKLDERSDLWSLGIVMYELLSGVPPFDGDGMRLIEAIVRRDAVPLCERKPSVTPALSAIVAKCLERERAKRWARTADLARALVPHGSQAWSGALERIERALAQATPMSMPRRYATYETALQALEVDLHGGVTAIPAPIVIDHHNADAFNATLPAPPSAPSERTDTLESASFKRPLRILLVEDSALALEIHGHALGSAGFDVRTTSAASELDALLESFKPHLVLMDVEMPDTKGDELCRRVKAKYGSKIPIVLLSSLGKEVLADVAKRGGADAFFSETSDVGSFIEFVKNVCALIYSPEDLPDAVEDDLQLEKE